MSLTEIALQRASRAMDRPSTGPSGPHVAAVQLSRPSMSSHDAKSQQPDVREKLTTPPEDDSGGVDAL
jgi:hypothetical protein